MNITNYARQSTKPEWFNSNTTSIFTCATSGSSPFNEWYEFKNKKEAVRFINSTFSSQSFLDSYIHYEGDFYNDSECFYNENEEFVPNEAAEPVSIDDLVQAESKF